MPHTTSISADYFEQMFRDNADPWGFETSAYEQAKYAESIAALGTRHYERMLEVGCANGVLTHLLAPFADQLLAVDVSETALATARTRCAGVDAVRFERMMFPRETPRDGPFNLVVLSEVAYYWDDADLERTCAWLATGIPPGGEILLVHWTGETDYPQSGDEAVAKLQASLHGRIEVVRAERHPEYRLDHWRLRA